MGEFMKNGYLSLNAKTFDIENQENLILVDASLAKTVSLLNKKGYHVNMCSNARISTTFLIGAIVQGLIDEKILEINNLTKNKIKKVIQQNDYQSIILIFEDDYKFKSLPEGFRLIGKNLTYYLSTFSDGNDIKFKTLIELDCERDESLKKLEEWANNLPYN